jgi:hypothetical protein
MVPSRRDSALLSRGYPGLTGLAKPMWPLSRLNSDGLNSSAPAPVFYKASRPARMGGLTLHLQQAGAFDTISASLMEL